jgi:hypothetical protein
MERVSRSQPSMTLSLLVVTGIFTLTACESRNGTVEAKELTEQVSLEEMASNGCNFSTLRLAPDGDWTKSHTDTDMTYVTWNGSRWCARICGNSFEHAPICDWGKSHTGESIDYMFWNNTRWSAKLHGKVFEHAPDGDWSKTHMGDTLAYQAWDGTNWIVMIQ